MKLWVYVALLFSVSGCNATKMNDSASCIQRYIDANKNSADWPVSSVDEYEFQGKLVYAFNPPRNYADASLRIKSGDCKDLCNVGGFAGRRNSNCNGDNFFEKAVLKRRLWSREK